MSSILTNNSAMVALQTLKSVNASLTQTQSDISTGKSVASAKDDAAVWSISKVMESDVKGFKGISESLSLGQSTVTVGRQAAETVTDLLTDIKGKIVAAQESNVPRETIQEDISALRDQIKSVTNAAQFNGLNLVQGTENVEILSSLDRDSNGTVSASNISISRNDLTSDSGKFGSGNTLADNITASAATVAGDGSPNKLDLTLVGTADGGDTINIGGTTFTATDNTAAARGAAFTAAINQAGLTGITASDDGSGVLTLTNTNSFEEFAVTFDADGANTIAAASSADSGDDVSATAASGTTVLSRRAEDVALDNAAKVNEGDSYRISVAGTDYDYVAGKGETMEDVARGLKTSIDGGDITDVSTRVVQEDDQWKVLVDYAGSGTITLTDAGQQGGVASGGLFGLDNIDVTSEQGAASALDNIETLIQNSVDAAASFGSAQGRIDTQSSFISNLSDSLKAGIGTLVDADMEETSARLQALQVQQQLATQSLSIANQAPQSILSLFR